MGEKMKSKYFFILLALLVILVSVASAADVDDTIVSSSDATTTIHEDTQAVDTQVITNDNSNNEIKNTQNVTKVTKEANKKKIQDIHRKRGT